jgi:GDP-mannose transporter
MTLTNKLVLSSYNFRLNFLFLAIQSIGCVLLLELFTIFGITSHRGLNKHDSILWIKVAFLLVLMIYTGSKALQFLSIPVFTIFKNLTIIIIAYLERHFFNGSPITPVIFTSFSLIVLSSLIAGLADYQSATHIKDNASFFVAYTWMLVNCLCSTAFTLIMKGTIKRVKFKDFDTVYYNSRLNSLDLLSIPILLLFSYFTEYELALEAYQRYFGIESIHNLEEFRGLRRGIFFSTLCTFGISYSTSWCLRVTGATTYRYKKLR